MRSSAFFVVSWIAWVLFAVTSPGILRPLARPHADLEITLLLDPSIEDPKSWIHLLTFLPGSLLYEIKDKNEVYRKIQQVNPKLASAIQLVGPEILPTEIDVRFRSRWVFREKTLLDSLISRLPGVLRVSWSGHDAEHRQRVQGLWPIIYVLLLLGLAILGEIEGLRALRVSQRIFAGLLLTTVTTLSIVLLRKVLNVTWGVPGFPWFLGIGVFFVALITLPEPSESLETGKEP